MNYATTQGTSHYASERIEEGLPPQAFRTLGRTGWTTSVLGFGCYRVDDENPSHRASLEKALAQSCNLIDTSTNYTDGSSELCIGHTLQNLFQNGTLRRDEVIVVSKVGYVQGQNLELALQRESNGEPYPEMVKYMEGCWHCISPDFISEQLTLSLERLQLERIDVFLLHNPEYFFSEAKKHKDHRPLNELRVIFYERIRRAFERLEEEVARGRITCYGVSSNTFGVPGENFEATSLTRMWEIAREVGQKRYQDPSLHRFSVVQLPLNLLENGPCTEKNNGPGNNKTFLEFAMEKDLGVLVNRPLNAFLGDQLVRLADFPVVSHDEDIDDVLQDLSGLEQEFVEHIAPSIKVGGGSAPADELFRWSQELSSPQLRAVPAEHWSQIEGQMIQPQIRYLVGELDAYFHSDADSGWHNWKEKYLGTLERTLSVLRNHGAEQSQRTSQALSQRLNAFLPDSLHRESFSRKALGVLINTPGVSCVLNGMRSMRYVEDSLGVMGLPCFDVKTGLFESFRCVEGR